MKMKKKLSSTKESSLADVQGFCFHTPSIQDRSTSGGGSMKKVKRVATTAQLKPDPFYMRQSFGAIAALIVRSQLPS